MLALMKILLYGIGGLAAVIVLLLVGLSLASRKQPEPGLVDGRLRPCPHSPNCVCSEWPQQGAFIEPLVFTTTASEAWRSAKQAVTASGGEIVMEEGGYLHARYVTPILRFVDDVELRLDVAAQVIHVRSASRVGHSDLGANRKRVARLRAAFKP